MENDFSTRYRGRGRSIGQFHNKGFYNQNICQHNSQGNASTSRSREEVQIGSEEEVEKDLVEEEEEEMDLEQDKDHIVIIVTILVILRKIVLQNYVIWNIKVPIQLLKKIEMRSYSYQV
jgi:superfamily I DNA and/or RNA helicase